MLAQFAAGGLVGRQRLGALQRLREVLDGVGGVAVRCGQNASAVGDGRVQHQPRAGSKALVDLGWNPEFQTLYLLMFVAFVPLFEEWWWRGQALPRCEQAFGCRAGVVIAALGFASYHLVVLWALYDPALAFLRWTGITIGGLVWTFIAHRQRSWHWTWVAHFAADAAIVVAFLLWIQK